MRYLAIIPSAICAGGGLYLAIHDLSGWGWFLIAAIVLFPTIRTGKVAELHAQKELEESRRSRL